MPGTSGYNVRTALKFSMGMLAVFTAIYAIFAVALHWHYQVSMGMEYHFEVITIVALCVLGSVMGDKMRFDMERTMRTMPIARQLSYLRWKRFRMYIYACAMYLVPYGALVALWNFYDQMPTWLNVMLVTVGVIGLVVAMSPHNSHRFEVIDAKIAQLKARLSFNANQST